MDLPRNEEYSRAEYWDRRYSSEESYEWLGGFSSFKQEIRSVLGQHHFSDSILQLGCGNSSLTSDMRKEGWMNITNIDISINGLRKLRERERQSNYLLMDMGRMPFMDHSHDIVIEKATLDSLLVTADSPWDLHSSEHLLVGRVLREVKRILRPGGTFLSITFSQPHFRVPLLCKEELGWSVCVHKVEGSGLQSYMVVVRDGDPTPALNKYSHSYSLQIQPNLEWESSDEEEFLNHLDILSDQEELEEEDLSSSSQEEQSGQRS